MLLPSVVRYLEQGRRQIGFAAQSAQADDPQNTLVSVKRFMGRSLTDVKDPDKLPYHFVDQPGMLSITKPSAASARSATCRSRSAINRTSSGCRGACSKANK